MAGSEIEIILSRQLADCLSVPVFIVDPEGNLLFYNEPAEQVLGVKYEDTGEMPVARWSTMFTPRDKNGQLLPPGQLPLVKTLQQQKPAHGSFWIKSMNGSNYEISVTSYPIIGRSKAFSGAVAIFWMNTDQDEV
jgi:PAS domain-containing protein